MTFFHIFFTYFSLWHFDKAALSCFCLGRCSAALFFLSLLCQQHLAAVFPPLQLFLSCAHRQVGQGADTQPSGNEAREGNAGWKRSYEGPRSHSNPEERISSALPALCQVLVAAQRGQCCAHLPLPSRPEDAAGQQGNDNIKGSPCTSAQCFLSFCEATALNPFTKIPSADREQL